MKNNSMLSVVYHLTLITSFTQHFNYMDVVGICNFELTVPSHWSKLLYNKTTLVLLSYLYKSCNLWKCVLDLTVYNESFLLNTDMNDSFLL